MTWTCLCEEHSEPVLSGRSVPLHNNTFPSLALSHITRVWKASLLQEIDLAGYRGELPSSSKLESRTRCPHACALEHTSYVKQ